MVPFLVQVADDLLRRFGPEGLADCTLFLPSLRARLFFMQAVSRHLDRPAWMPRWGDLGQLMEAVSGYEQVDNIYLLPVLHRLYVQHTGSTKPLEEFFSWGQVLLGDFDQVDKYRCDAQALFSNLQDLKELEHSIEFLDEAQRSALAQFFEEFGRGESGAYRLRHRFLQLWRVLLPIYGELKAYMVAQRRGYAGFVSRAAAARLLALRGEARAELPVQMVFVGFNALNACEQVLFDVAHKYTDALFYWNYHPDMVRQPVLESGLFMRRNLRRYPSALGLDQQLQHHRPRVRVLAAPSNVTQAEILASRLEELVQPAGAGAGAGQTAIVLADESLLMPVLRTLPEALKPYNVTMGYPIIHTLAYTFIELFLELQRGYDEQEAMVRREALVQFLSHPYVQLVPGSAECYERYVASVEHALPVEALDGWPWRSSCFPRSGRDATQLKRLLVLLVEVADLVDQSAAGTGAEPAQTMDGENLFTSYEKLTALDASLQEASIVPTPGLLLQLLPQAFRDAKADFLGQPLHGTQIMGFLESRVLDFDRLFILSCSEAFLPRNAWKPSFIPWTLQRAFGLPTAQEREAMYAYYFHTLTMRAQEVDLVYTESATLGPQGEPSRYLLQQLYPLQGEPAEWVHYAFNPSACPARPIVIEKTGALAEQLSAYLCESNARPVRLSPAAINCYIECPLRFYFKYLAGIAEPEVSITEEFTAQHFGLIVHEALQHLYAPLVGVSSPGDASCLTALLRRADRETGLSFLAALGRPAEEGQLQALSGYWQLHLHAAREVVKNAIAQDRVRWPQVQMVQSLEQEVEGELQLPNGAHVLLGGRVDRLDLLRTGHLMVLDYKTGGYDTHYDTYTTAEEQVAADRVNKGYLLQVLLYAHMLGQSGRLGAGEPCVEVGLWFPLCRKLDYLPGMRVSAQGARGEAEPATPAQYPSIVGSLVEAVAAKVGELLDVNTPFTQTPCEQNCAYCAYRPLCMR